VRITIKQLEYFVATAEVGSIKHASLNIHISQPSISSAISHLEDELQVQLFVRHHAKGLDLTMSGKRIFKEAKLLVKRAEELYLIGSELNDEIVGKITIGCMVTLAPVIMAELGQSFTKAYPSVDLSLVEGSHAQLVEKLRHVEIDAAITYDLQSQDEIEFLFLANLPPHILLSRNHPLAKLTSITLGQLEKEPMILLDLPHSRQYFLSLFQGQGLNPTIKQSSANQETIRTMVANGFGYTIANIRPKNLVALDGRKLVSVNLEGNHKPMKIGIAVLSQQHKPRILQAFEQHCVDLISNSNIPGMLPL
jgi:DNA-binding transcriptional LysR family regulator